MSELNVKSGEFIECLCIAMCLRAQCPPYRPSAPGLWPRWGHAHPSWSFWALPFLCDLLYERWPPQRLEWPRVAPPQKKARAAQCGDGFGEYAGS